MISPAVELGHATRGVYETIQRVSIHENVEIDNGISIKH
jgi:UDP-3-O-[3-hydroxymyristoyl] glucosamine N-acyltransferase